MSSIDRIAAIMFLISGSLVMAFGLFSVLGTLVSALMAVAAIASDDAELLIAFPMVVIYAVFMVVGLASGAIQIVGGVRMLRGQKDTLTWVAAFAALAAVITVYCTLPGLIAFSFALASLVSVPPEEEGTGSARIAAERLKAVGPGEPFDPPAA